MSGMRHVGSMKRAYILHSDLKSKYGPYESLGPGT
jgi:hypothetical protein